MNFLLEHGGTWLLILFCLSQSAIFSGLNLAYFSVSRLRLKTSVSVGDRGAEEVLDKRADSNFLLTTLLWGNVGINVLLTLLTNSILSGVGAFLFSTVGITLFCESAPQAYFSRHALRMAHLFSPVITFYQLILYPVAKPSALLLDSLLGKEAVVYFREANLQEILKEHVKAKGTEIDRIEGIGALNFLNIDDVKMRQEGERIDSQSVIELPSRDGTLEIPDYEAEPEDPFLQRIQASGYKWIILVNENEEPEWVLDADRFLRAVLFEEQPPDVRTYCHRPVVVERTDESLEMVLERLRDEEHPSEISPEDIVLLWGDERKIITGSDILGRLLEGI